MMRRYQRGAEYPHEQFVQAAIERYFTGLGFLLLPHRFMDLVAVQPERGECWAVEAKGVTTAVGLDFRTGLGQLVQRIDDPTWNYGLAVPAIPQFAAQCEQVQDWVRAALRLHWLLVDGDGAVQIHSPRTRKSTG